MNIKPCVIKTISLFLLLPGCGQKIPQLDVDSPQVFEGSGNPETKNTDVDNEAKDPIDPNLHLKPIAIANDDVGNFLGDIQSVPEFGVSLFSEGHLQTVHLEKHPQENKLIVRDYDKNLNFKGSLELEKDDRIGLGKTTSEGMDHIYQVWTGYDRSNENKGKNTFGLWGVAGGKIAYCRVIKAKYICYPGQNDIAPILAAGGRFEGIGQFGEVVFSLKTINKVFSTFSAFFSQPNNVGIIRDDSFVNFDSGLLVKKVVTASGEVRRTELTGSALRSLGLVEEMSERFKYSQHILNGERPLTPGLTAMALSVPAQNLRDYYIVEIDALPKLPDDKSPKELSTLKIGSRENFGSFVSPPPKPLYLPSGKLWVAYDLFNPETKTHQVTISPTKSFDSVKISVPFFETNEFEIVEFKRYPLGNLTLVVNETKRQTFKIYEFKTVGTGFEFWRTIRGATKSKVMFHSLLNLDFHGMFFVYKENTENGVFKGLGKVDWGFPTRDE